MTDRRPRPRAHARDQSGRSRRRPKNTYYYFDPNEDAFVAIAPRRLETMARAIAVAVSAVVLGSLLFLQWAA